MPTDPDPLAQLKASGTAGGGSSAPVGAPQVFLGQSAVMTARETADGFAHGNLQKTMQEKLTTIDGAKSQWFVMSDAERTAIATRLYRAGVISAPTYAAAQSKWFDAVEQAAGFYGAGKKVTPWQMLDVFEGGASAGGRGGGGAAAGPRTTTSTSKSVDLPTAAQATEAVKAIFQDKLGRDPDDGELSRYSGIITAGAKASPTITKTTQTVDANGNSTSSSTSSGGFTQTDAQHLLTEQAEKDPEYGAYQAATFYHDTLLRALAAPA